MNKQELPNDIEHLKSLVLRLYDEKELFRKRAAYLEAWIFEEENAECRMG